jgi:single-strand DNA-binding protein
VEKYSTEIVLQKFRGELTMIGGRGEGASGGAGGDDYGSSSGFQSGGRAQGAGPRESFSADLDDEIPF